MRRLAYLLVGTLIATPASAEVVALWAQIRAGGSTGTGLGGDQKENDFFRQSAGFTYGFLLGAKVLFLRGWIDHHQYTSFSEFRGTWTQFMLGGGFDVGLSDVPVGELPPVELGIGFGVGFGLGTGRQIMPPLDNAQVSDKGFVAEVSAALKYRFNRVVALGVVVPMTFGYLIKNDAPIGQAETYSSGSIKVLAALELTLGL